LIASTVPPLGLVEQPRFVEMVVTLEPHDAFVLYTDGLFGGVDGKHRRLTPEMLSKMIDPTAPSAEALLGRLLDQAAPSHAKTRLPDDVAAVAVRRTG